LAWFPAPGFRTWPMRARRVAVAVSGRLRAADGGKLRGSAGVFAWREPGPGPLRRGQGRPGPHSRDPASVPGTAPCVRQPVGFVIIEVRARDRSALPHRPQLVAAALPGGSQLTLDHLRAGCGLVVTREAPGREQAWLWPPPRRPDRGPRTARFVDHAEYVRRLRRIAELGHVMRVWCGVCKTVGSAYVGSNPTPATHVLPGQSRYLAILRGACGSGLRNR